MRRLTKWCLIVLGIPVGTLVALWCAFIITAIVAPWLLSPTSIEYGVGLPNGHQLVRTDARRISIASPRGRLGLFGEAAPAEIIAVGVKDEFVFGKIQRRPDIYVTRYELPVRISGYFILDTKTDGVQIGLDQVDRLAALKGLGIEQPVLKPLRDFTY